MVKQALLVVTWAGTLGYCVELLDSLSLYGKKIVVAINEIEACPNYSPWDLEWINKWFQVLPIQGNRWELGGLTAMMAFTPYDEFILLQDTLEVKDASIFDKMFDMEDRSVSYGPTWQCYLGKYRRQVLDQFPIPVALTKMDAFYHEFMLPKMYGFVAEKMEGAPPHIMFPEWGNDNPNNTFEEKFGRKNIVLANDYLIKRKSLEWEGITGYLATVEHR